MQIVEVSSERAVHFARCAKLSDHLSDLESDMHIFAGLSVELLKILQDAPKSEGSLRTRLFADLVHDPEPPASLRISGVVHELFVGFVDVVVGSKVVLGLVTSAEFFEHLNDTAILLLFLFFGFDRVVLVDPIHDEIPDPIELVGEFMKRAVNRTATLGPGGYTLQSVATLVHVICGVTDFWIDPALEFSEESIFRVLIGILFGCIFDLGVDCADIEVCEPSHLHSHTLGSFDLRCSLVESPDHEVELLVTLSIHVLKQLSEAIRRVLLQKDQPISARIEVIEIVIETVIWHLVTPFEEHGTAQRCRTSLRTYVRLPQGAVIGLVLKCKKEDRKCDQNEEDHKTCDHPLLDLIVPLVDLLHFRLEVGVRCVQLSEWTSAIESFLSAHGFLRKNGTIRRMIRMIESLMPIACTVHSARIHHPTSANSSIQSWSSHIESSMNHWLGCTN